MPECVDVTLSSPRPRKRAKLPLPGWAMSPELKQALEAQCTLNPEEIFGKMAPLRIEGKFRDNYIKNVSEIDRQWLN